MGQQFEGTAGAREELRIVLGVPPDKVVAA